MHRIRLGECFAVAWAHVGSLSRIKINIPTLLSKTGPAPPPTEKYGYSRVTGMGDRDRDGGTLWGGNAGATGVGYIVVGFSRVSTFRNI